MAERIRQRDIEAFLNRLAPFATQLEGDNAGFLAGNPDDVVTGIGVCLDITPDAVASAAAQECNLIVSHHPVIYPALRRIAPGSAVEALVQYHVGAVCAHTNLDAADGGVNDCLCETLGLSDLLPLYDPHTPGKPAIARIGSFEAPMEPDEFAAYVGQVLLTTVRVHCAPRPVRTVAVCGGAGGDLLGAAYRAGADAFVTGEIKHHQWIEAAGLDMTVIDAGHFPTEQVVVAPLAKKLQGAFPGIPVEVLPQECPYDCI